MPIQWLFFFIVQKEHGMKVQRQKTHLEVLLWWRVILKMESTCKTIIAKGITLEPITFHNSKFVGMPSLKANYLLINSIVSTQQPPPHT
jgi:hypothetical protein